MSCVTLFTKDRCALCDEAKQMLDGLDHPYRTATDPSYALRVPVIEVAGRVVTEGRVSERVVRRAIRRAR